MKDRRILKPPGIQWLAAPRRLCGAERGTGGNVSTMPMPSLNDPGGDVMNSIADLLPPEIARQIHPDRRRNEARYWAARDKLLDQYRDQWVGFADGAVIASGTSPVTVFHAAEASGRHPFLVCVGNEQQPCRIRR